MRIGPSMLQLVFHRGAKVQPLPEYRLIDDPKNLLMWKSNDRAILTIKNDEAISTYENDICQLIKNWINAAAIP